MTSGAKAVTKPSGNTSVILAGDVTGPSGSNTVAKINGSALGTTTGATSGQYLAWNGSAWVPTTPAAGGVTSFNTRTGAVVPANADYLAVASGGLTGAVAATRYVGGTTNGAPTAGTFAVGDFIVDQTASIWVCTVAGTPGTWATTISNHMTLRSATATAKYNEITLFQGSTASQTISAASSPIDSTTWTIINNSSVTVTAGFSANAMYPLGSASSVTSLTVPVNAAYSFVNYNGGNWYMVASNNAANIQGTLAVANGGTGLTSLGTAGQVLTVNSGATALQYSTPATTTSVTMGGDVTGNSATSTVAKLQGVTVSTTAPTANQVLTYNSGTTSWTPTTPSASALTTSSSWISAAVFLTTANTFYNVTSLSLAAGTWLINAQANFQTTSTTLQAIELFIGNTSTSATGALYGQYTYVPGTVSGATHSYLSFSSTIVLASTTTIYLIADTNVSNSIISYSGYNASYSSSGMTAVKIA